MSTPQESLRLYIRKTISESFILREDAQHDIDSNNEARRIYNKILRNIQTVTFYPTTDRDFVNDTKGNAHQLNGVKFNLSQLKEKYDLDILFVNELGRNLANYDRNNNRIVFFILGQMQKPIKFDNASYLARLRFKPWIEENLFAHEFVHFLDDKRYSSSYSFSKPNTSKEYYNSPEEYNAYAQEIIGKAIKNKKQLIGITFKSFLKKSLSLGPEFFIKSLNDIYRKKLINRLYKIYEEINSSQSINEAYDDVPMEDIKNGKKLEDYQNYTNKKVIGDNTYLEFNVPDDWVLWATILVFDNNDGTEIANATYGKKSKYDDLKASVDVRSDKRRTGIASNIYQWIEELAGETLYPDTPHSKSASLLWKNPNRKFGPKQI